MRQARVDAGGGLCARLWSHVARPAAGISRKGTSKRLDWRCKTCGGSLQRERDVEFLDPFSPSFAPPYSFGAVRWTFRLFVGSCSRKIRVR